MKTKYFKLISLFVLSVLLILFAFICFYKLGSTPLENWDESFYAETAKQMILNHNFITPYFNDKIFLEKPPLQIWITTLGGMIFGLSEFIVRFPSAFFSLITMIIVVTFCQKRFGFLPTIFAFTTLAFNNIFIWRSRTGNLDILTTFFFVIIFLLIQSSSKYKYQLLGFCFGLLYLTKLGIVLFPLFIFIVDEILFNRKNIRLNYKKYIQLVICALILPSIWLMLGYLQVGIVFIQSYIFNFSQGVSDKASLTSFNFDYISYAYYSLQRRFFWFLLFGLILLIIKIKNRQNLLLFLFSTLLWIQLLFVDRKNNWYLVPLMPFWSLTIGYGIWQLILFVSKFKIKYIKQIIFISLLLFCCVIGYKTYTVNITPLFYNNTTIKEMQTAMVLKQLTNNRDVIIRLDNSYPVTIYYSDRHINVLPFLTLEGTTHLISTSPISYVAGTKSDAQNLIKLVPGKKYEEIPTNDREEIVKFY